MALPSRILDLPGVFAPHALREAGDAPGFALAEPGFALAEAVARAPREGAGTLAWICSAARAEAAVVLEPEMPLREARLARLVAGNALIDALGALGPPEVPLAWRWPDGLLVNGADCGRLLLSVPPGSAEAAVPEWLVVGFAVTLALPACHEPGHAPDRTSLAEEGFAGLDAATLTAAWARHLMAGLDRWAAEGRRRTQADFQARLADPGTASLWPELA